jgi:hypothetical protein
LMPAHQQMLKMHLHLIIFSMKKQNDLKEHIFSVIEKLF